jgi:predicted DNA-binding transcriptional regulator AlpA
MTTKIGASLDEILRNAGPTISVPAFGEIVGISRDSAYRLAKRGELGVRVLRLGRRMVIPISEVRRLLGEDGPNAA